MRCIVSAGNTGKRMTCIDKGRMVGWSLNLDIQPLLLENKMYWVDGHSEKIESASLADISGTRKLLRIEPTLADPFAVAVTETKLYWSDWYYKGLISSNKDGTNRTVLHADRFTGLNEILYIKKGLRDPPSRRTCLCYRYRIFFAKLIIRFEMVF